MHFIIVHKASLTILTLAMSLFVADVSLFSRAPQQTPTQTCADAEMRRAEADLRAAAAELHCEILKTRREEVEKINTSQKAALASAREGLTNEKGHSAMLTAKNVEKDQAIDESKTLIAALTVKLDKAEQKIKAADGRWLCDGLGMWCINKR